jgi:hypothetical protein
VVKAVEDACCELPFRCRLLMLGRAGSSQRVDLCPLKSEHAGSVLFGVKARSLHSPNGGDAHAEKSGNLTSSETVVAGPVDSLLTALVKFGRFLHRSTSAKF